MTPQQARRYFAQAQVARLANIVVNPQVAILADHYDDDWNALSWMRADGSGRILEAGEPEDREAVAWLVTRYAQYRARPPQGPVVAINVTRWSSWAVTGS
jgi:PPOX class probable F420-dependent enzyme